MPISNETRRRLGPTDYAIAGSLSGMTSRFLTQPLDVVKIRFQLQVEPIHKGRLDAKYKGVVHAFKKIVNEEGATALWKGHVPAQLLSVVYGFSQFSTFELIARNTPGDTRHEPIMQFLCGAAAGFIATVVSFPFDVIRTRFVAQGEPKVYTGFFQAASRIYTREGPLALYKGLTPTLIQVAPATGAQFTSYALIKDIYRKIVDEDDSKNSVFSPMPIKGALICGSLSGIFTKTVIYPFDLIRKRMQVQGFEEERKKFGKVFRCSSFIDCFWSTIQEEKVRGLFKGLLPSVLKAGSMTAINFSVYEQICVFIAKSRPDPADEE